MQSRLEFAPNDVCKMLKMILNINDSHITVKRVVLWRAPVVLLVHHLVSFGFRVQYFIISVYCKSNMAVNELNVNCIGHLILHLPLPILKWIVYMYHVIVMLQ